MSRLRMTGSEEIDRQPAVDPRIGMDAVGTRGRRRNDGLPEHFLVGIGVQTSHFISIELLPIGVEALELAEAVDAPAAYLHPTITSAPAVDPDRIAGQRLPVGSQRRVRLEDVQLRLMVGRPGAFYVGERPPSACVQEKHGV